MPRRGDIKYIRFGKLPESGHSWNHRDNRPEPGTSCYELIYDGRKWRIGSVVGIATINFVNKKIPCYEVTGEVLSETGSDGEPLLVNASIVKRIPVRYWPSRLNRIGTEGNYSAWKDEFTGEIKLDFPREGAMWFESEEAVQRHYETLLSFSEYFAGRFMASCEVIGYYLLETIS